MSRKEIGRKFKKLFSRSPTPTPSAPVSRAATPNPPSITQSPDTTDANEASAPAAQMSDPAVISGSHHRPSSSATASGVATPKPPLMDQAPDPHEAVSPAPQIPDPSALGDSHQYLSLPPIIPSTPGSTTNTDRSPSTSTTAAPGISSILVSTLASADSRPSGKDFGWKLFMGGLGVLKEVSVVFPPLQAAVGGLLSVLDQFEEITDARDDLAEMAQRIAALTSLLRRYEGCTIDEDVLERLEGMATSVSLTKMIEEKLPTGVWKIAANSPDARYVIQCTQAVSFLINIFEMDTALHTEATINELKIIAADMESKTQEIRKNSSNTLITSDMLEKLAPVPGSFYNEGGGRMSECMPGTRVGVLTELMAWATDPTAPPVYLITGMAGAGKSAIARSFSRLLDRQMLLGASFFCSRASEARSNVGGIIPSLAFHLGWRSEPFARALINAIKMNPGTTFNLRKTEFQFATLLSGPSQAHSDKAQLLVIVIDALDECSSTDAVRALLKVLIQSRGVQLKFFITSRPEPYIKTAFHSEVVTRHLRLRDVEHDTVTADIAKYLRKHLGEIGSAIHAPT
ncbi:hypothetical protein DFH09DRAFT_1309561 [Mycena vulgaris]|nr:hypothetical protein DFH09DRAFT_1309561 [Mycena vulgaris]